MVLQPLKDDRSSCGVFTDIDGTISLITASPDESRISSEAKIALFNLTANFKLVCLVTGRDVETAVEMAGFEGLAYIGSHGMEICMDGKCESAPSAGRYADVMPEVAGILARRFSSDEGIEIEAKKLALGVHYRRAEHSEQARRTILTAVEPLLKKYGLKGFEARKALELRPDIPENKGRAISRVIERKKLTSAVYFGDDTTDISAFEAMDRVRKAGGYAVKVAVDSPEAPSALLERADLVLKGVSEVISVFTWLAA